MSELDVNFEPSKDQGFNSRELQTTDTFNLQEYEQQRSEKISALQELKEAKYMHLDEFSTREERGENTEYADMFTRLNDLDAAKRQEDPDYDQKVEDMALDIQDFGPVNIKGLMDRDRWIRTERFMNKHDLSIAMPNGRLEPGDTELKQEVGTDDVVSGVRSTSEIFQNSTPEDLLDLEEEERNEANEEENPDDFWKRRLG